MLTQKRIRDYGIKIGNLHPGPINAITDIAGVTVGHTTLSDGDVQTGVTAIIPHEGNIFQEKLVASSHVINGFCKSSGTVQINELGTLEAPIILTNTLSVGTAIDALTDYSLEKNSDIGRSTGSVNPVVGECNDMVLNDLRAKHVQKKHIFEAINQASSEFLEGAVGAGTGMVCYSLKGGIGSSSRQVDFEHGSYTLGVLVLSNFGKLPDLTVNYQKVGSQLEPYINADHQLKDKGSIMIIVGTDLPVCQSQLNRIIKRSVTGLSRTGSVISNGSGDVVIGFSTAEKIPHYKPKSIQTRKTIHEQDIDLAFRAVGEATEEAILNALITAESVVGRDGNYRHSLKDLLEKFDIELSTE